MKGSRKTLDEGLKVNEAHTKYANIAAKLEEKEKDVRTRGKTMTMTT